MSSDTPRDGRCNATTRDNGCCEKHPVDGADRCRLHGGESPGGTGPPGNQNAARHHLHADPADVLAHLDEHDPDAYEWVLQKYDSYLDSAPFDDGTAKADQLKQIAVQEYSMWKATGLQLQGGVVKQTDHPDEPVDITENPVNLPLDRMQRTVTRRLKELGVLDDPDSQQAAAAAGKVHALREMMSDVDAHTAQDGDDE